MPALSICLVTRDEEANLPRVLGSARGLADEVIVAETGSTDRTAEVAAELGARVLPFAWDDDFAAARNFALGHASGDWVLWLNPDEELTPDAGAVLKAALARDDAFAYLVPVHDLRGPGGPVSETWQPRLFRRRPEVRYVGRLHPRFATPLPDLAARAGQRVGQASLLVRRHAYLSKLDQGKLRWAARLLRRELEDRPDGLDYQIEYGRTLLWLNDPAGHDVLARAAGRVRAARDGAAPPAGNVGLLLEYALTASPEQVKGPLSRDEACALAERWYPRSPPMLWRAAEHHFRAGEYRRAAALLERLCDCARTGDYDRSEGFDPSILGEAPALNLGACYLHLGDFDRAEACFGGLLNSPVYADQAKKNLFAVRSRRKGAVKTGDAGGAGRSGGATASGEARAEQELGGNA
jgi:hypothetical protein